MFQPKQPIALLAGLVLCVSLACRLGQPAASDAVEVVIVPDATGTVEAQPAVQPTRLLSICTSREPASLFIYADGSAAARTILQAVYDGPYDLKGFTYQPVLLENVPGRPNGGVVIEPISVARGSIISDRDGNLVALAEGVSFLPSGCQEIGCARVYEGQEPAVMDQLVVRFRLRPGLAWSDGAPLTADDSIYSYQIARQLYPQTRTDFVPYTAAYQALDAQTVEWRGLPGYSTPDYALAFFAPLPRHQLGALAIQDLQASELVNRAPLGWGPYILEEWSPGNQITLRRNPSYFRAAEGLPVFDRMVFRFISDQDQAIAALLAGECDLLDDSLALESRLDQLQNLQQEGKLQVHIGQRMAWEHLDFGIQSLNPANLPHFQLKETRQAVAYCTDRQRIVNEITHGQAVVLDQYVSPAHPLFNPQAKTYAFDPQAGAQILEGLGWIDGDGDPVTPRLAQGVPGIPDGTLFEVTLLVTEDAEKQRLGQILKDSLAQCGVRLNLQSLPAEQLFTPGPGGLLFGRNFALAQFGWAASAQPPCFLFTTSQIPGPSPEYVRSWGGANASGYSNPQFDQLCWQANRLLPDDSAYTIAQQQAQAILAEDLPVLPLYAGIQVVVANPALCGLQLDPVTESVLWNLETFDHDSACLQR